MNTKAKSFLLLLSVLLIGIIIGALGNSLIRKNIIEERISRFRSPQGFTERLIEVIEPDEQQREKIEAILLRHHQKMLRLGEKARKEMKVHADSLMNELKPILNEEQLERLDKMLTRPPRPFHKRPEERPARHRE